MLAFLNQFILYFRTKKYFWIEEKKVRKFFATCKIFQQVDSAFQRKYLFKNPYQISKKFLRNARAAEIHAYGETPLTTMWNIAKKCNISSSDVVIEMGAGRGRAALFLATFIQCKVIAYEQIPDFATVAREIANTYRCTCFVMHSADMFQANFQEATAIYLYGTMLSDEEIRRLIEKFPTNIKIITVSYPLNDYSKNFKTIKTFSGSFPWGETNIFWNEKI